MKCRGMKTRISKVRSGFLVGKIGKIEEYFGVTFYLETVQDELPLGQLVVVSCEHMYNVNIQCSLKTKMTGDLFTNLTYGICCE